MLFRLIFAGGAIPAFRTAIFETVGVFASAALMAVLPHLFMRDKGRETRTLLSTFILMIGVMGAAPFAAQIDFTPDPVVVHAGPQDRPAPAVIRASAPAEPAEEPPAPAIRDTMDASADANGSSVEGKTIPEVEGERKYFAEGVGAFRPDGEVEDDAAAGPTRQVAAVSGGGASGNRALAHFNAARAAQAAGRVDEALGRYRAARADFRAAGDRMGEANSLQGEGESLRALGQDEAAATAHDAALDRYAALGVDVGRANALLGLGFASQRVDPAAAAARFRDAAAVYDAAGLGEWATRARRAWAALPRAARLAAPLN